jgi:hypothetical protein
MMHQHATDHCRTVHLAARKSWTLRILDFDENPTFVFFLLRNGTLVYSEPARFICPFEAKLLTETARAPRASCINLLVAKCTVYTVVYHSVLHW